ncbi:MAG TPA: TadE/TadG family type IV pilus assembly protein [Actinomycetota bacterium]|nr:TadE/TadG family type IV pilus assembly protein [Actinomycetota bacterium]
MRLRRLQLRKNDRGTVALEFALIVPVFLLLVYGGLSFGLAMAAKGVMTESAAEGARAAVGAAPDASGNQCFGYQNTAKAAAQNAIKSMSQNSFAQITATAVPCNASYTAGVTVTVAVSFPYSAHPSIPNAPGLGLVMPSSLNVQYSVGVS